MSSGPTLLRILLSVLLCLNGSTALWASTGMALDPEHMAHAGDGDAHDAHDGARVVPDADAVHASAAERHQHDGEECRCGAGMIAGCSCNCAYPAGFIAVTVPFAAQHALRSAAPGYAEIHAPQRSSGAIFRPPIS